MYTATAILIVIASILLTLVEFCTKTTRVSNMLAITMRMAVAVYMFNYLFFALFLEQGSQSKRFFPDIAK